MTLSQECRESAQRRAIKTFRETSPPLSTRSFTNRSSSSPKVQTPATLVDAFCCRVKVRSSMAAITTAQPKIVIFPQSDWVTTSQSRSALPSRNSSLAHPKPNWPNGFQTSPSSFLVAEDGHNRGTTTSTTFLSTRSRNQPTAVLINMPQTVCCRQRIPGSSKRAFLFRR